MRSIIPLSAGAHELLFTVRAAPQNTLVCMPLGRQLRAAAVKQSPQEMKTSRFEFKTDSELFAYAVTYYYCSRITKFSIFS